MRRAVVLSLSTLVGLLALPACGACDEDAEHPAASPREPETPPPEQEPELGPGPGSPREADVRRLLDRWLAAQNDGDFEAYSALYAERFEGVKRSGERAYRFDREGWLADRRRMFARPMHVEASGVEVRLAPRSAAIAFEQTWSAETYRDVGPKQLVLVRERDALRIGREEMLRSVLAEPGATEPLSPGRFMLVVDADGLHAVIAPASADAPAEGPLHLARRAGPSVAWRLAAVDGLPSEVRELAGAEVAVYAATGIACTGRLGPLRILRRVVPHFGTVQTWDGEGDGRARNDEEIARDVWGLGADGALLAAPIEDAAACAAEAAAFATRTDGPSPLLFMPRPSDPALVTRSLAVFDALPASRTIARDFRSYGGRGAWREHEGATPTVTRWEDPASHRAFVSVEVRVSAGCADFSASLTALFEDGGRALVPRTDPTVPIHFSPRAVVDLDGDGQMEVVLPDGLLRAGENGYLVRTLDVTPPYFDCDC